VNLTTFYLSPAIIFQTPASSLQAAMVDFHNYIMFYLLLICTFVVYIFMMIIYYYHLIPYDTTNYQGAFLRDFMLRNGITKQAHGRLIEVVWTLVPTLILIFIAFPSFALLYTTDEQSASAVCLRVVGHQWYWSYELPFNTQPDPEAVKAFVESILQSGESIDDVLLDSSYKGLLRTVVTPERGFLSQTPNTIDVYTFSSYMKGETDLNLGDFRLLEVDNPLFLPQDISIRALITAEDVIHSWAIPSLGVKVDAIPGRLNQVSLFN